MNEVMKKKIAMAGQIPVYCAFDEIIPIDSIKANPKNPNVHSADQITLLEKIISKQGWRSPIVISKRSGFVVKGHGRLMAAIEGDMEVAPVDYQDYDSEAAEYEDMIADNRLSELSNMDSDLLADILDEFPEMDFEMTGYSEDEISEILGIMDAMVEEAEEDQAENPTYELIVTCTNEDMMNDFFNTFTNQGLTVRKSIK